MGFSSGALVKNLPANAGDAEEAGSILWLGRSPAVGNGNSLQNAWKIPWAKEPGRLQSTGVAKNQT